MPMYSHLSTIFWLDLGEILGLKSLYYSSPKGLHIQGSKLFVGSHETEKKKKKHEILNFMGLNPQGLRTVCCCRCVY